MNVAIHRTDSRPLKSRRLISRTQLRTTPERSRLMARVRQHGTSAELCVKQILQRKGIHFVAKASQLPGSPDLFCEENRWAIFVHGCFWHAHKNCVRWRVPKSNQEYWRKKFADNRRRDKRSIISIKKMGYSALVVWECELPGLPQLERRIDDFLKQSGGVQ